MTYYAIKHDTEWYKQDDLLWLIKHDTEWYKQDDLLCY